LFPIARIFEASEKNIFLLAGESQNRENILSNRLLKINPEPSHERRESILAAGLFNI
jgi:hypothetical protein